MTLWDWVLATTGLYFSLSVLVSLLLARMFAARRAEERFAHAQLRSAVRAADRRVAA